MVTLVGTDPAVRPAATVILLRDSPAGPEVFMVRRHSASAFMANAHVFPGGRVDQADFGATAAWCDGVAAASTQLDGLKPADALAHAVAAARELFEEAGVLLARNNLLPADDRTNDQRPVQRLTVGPTTNDQPSTNDRTNDQRPDQRLTVGPTTDDRASDQRPDQRPIVGPTTNDRTNDQRPTTNDQGVPRLSRLRGDVHSGRRTFRDIVETEGLRLGLDLLVPFAHWVTPPGDTRCFDTRFFAASLPPGQSPVHDGAEAIDSAWFTPAHAIAAAIAETIVLPVPTWVTLRELQPFTRVDEALAWARTRTIERRQPHADDENGRRIMVVPGGRPDPPESGSNETPFETRFVRTGDGWRPESWPLDPEDPEGLA